MSIEGKHAYRFGYLKSEAWSNVRIEALAREKGRCQICGEESISNDAHHVWYPENIYETTEAHLVILCRPCHEFCHSMLPECKTKDEEFGRQEWLKFKNAVISWRRDKIKIFQTGEDIPPKLVRAAELRTAYENMRAKCGEQDRIIAAYKIQTGDVDPAVLATIQEKDKSHLIENKSFEHQWKVVHRIMNQWAPKLKQLEIHENNPVDNGDYRI